MVHFLVATLQNWINNIIIRSTMDLCSVLRSFVRVSCSWCNVSLAFFCVHLVKSLFYTVVYMIFVLRVLIYDLAVNFFSYLKFFFGFVVSLDCINFVCEMSIHKNVHFAAKLCYCCCYTAKYARDSNGFNNMYFAYFKGNKT